MASCVSGSRPLPEPILSYCHLNPWKVTLESIYKLFVKKFSFEIDAIFSETKFTLSHFVQASMQPSRINFGKIWFKSILSRNCIWKRLQNQVKRLLMMSAVNDAVQRLVKWNSDHMHTHSIIWQAWQRASKFLYCPLCSDKSILIPNASNALVRHNNSALTGLRSWLGGRICSYSNNNDKIITQFCTCQCHDSLGIFLREGAHKSLRSWSQMSHKFSLGQKPRYITCKISCIAWWRHQMETVSALLAICAGNSPVPGQWRGALMFSLICVWIKGWVNNREAGDLRRYQGHYDVIVMALNLTGAPQCYRLLQPSLRAMSNSKRVEQEANLPNPTMCQTNIPHCTIL